MNLISESQSPVTIGASDIPQPNNEFGRVRMILTKTEFHPLDLADRQLSHSPH